MVLFLKKVRLLRYMEMCEPLGTKCSGRASQRRVSRNVEDKSPVDRALVAPRRGA